MTISTFPPWVRKADVQHNLLSTRCIKGKKSSIFGFVDNLQTGATDRGPLIEEDQDLDEYAYNTSCSHPTAF